MARNMSTNMDKLDCCSALPPNEDGTWNEEEVKRAAEEVAKFFRM